MPQGLQAMCAAAVMITFAVVVKAEGYQWIKVDGSGSMEIDLGGQQPLSVHGSELTVNGTKVSAPRAPSILPLIRDPIGHTQVCLILLAWVRDAVTFRAFVLVTRGRVEGISREINRCLTRPGLGAWHGLWQSARAATWFRMYQRLVAGTFSIICVF